MQNPKHPDSTQDKQPTTKTKETAKTVTRNKQKPDERRDILRASKPVRKEYYKAKPEQGTLAPYKAGFGPQLTSGIEVALSDADRFMLARYYPGEIQTPFMNSTNRIPIPTSTFHSNYSISSCSLASNQDGPAFPLGTSPYLMLAFCPTLSLALGTGSGFAYPTTTHLSGLYITQGDLSQGALYRDGFDRVARSPSALSVYGSNFDTFAQTGFVWSAALDLSILCPLANLVGARFSGCLTLASIPSTGLTFSKLIQLASESGTASTSVTLRGAVTNTALPTTALQPNTNDSFADFSNEIVHYVILQTPVISITSGSAQYSLIGSLKGNVAWWPTTTDVLASNMAQPVGQSTNPNSYLRNLIYDPLMSGLPKLAEAILNPLSLLKLAPKALSGIAPSSVSKIFNLQTNPFNSKTIGPQEKCFYIRAFQEMRTALTHLRCESLSTWVESVNEAIDRWELEVDSYPDNIVPATIPLQPPMSEGLPLKIPLSKRIDDIPEFMKGGASHDFQQHGIISYK